MYTTICYVGLIAFPYTSQAGPIHGPLRDMGFTDAHIRSAREALNVRSDDTTARSINRFIPQHIM